jgi:multidrug efflux system membrane fusion protein
MSRRSDAAVVVLAVALAVACAKKEEEAPVAAQVVVQKAGVGSVENTLELSGRLVPPPNEDATLAPQIAGRLLTVNVREGERVKQGDLLATVDPAPFAEAERAADAALTKSRAEAGVKERAASLTAKLFEKGIASAEERDNDRAAAEAARAAVVDAEAHAGEARRRREWTRLAAPFGGVVAQVTRHAGETIDGTPGTPVLRLLGTTAAEASADAAAPDLARLKAGDTVSVVSGTVVAPASVVRVPAAVDPATGLGEVRARLSGAAPAPLLSTVTLRIVLARKDGVVVVPPRAVRRAEDGTDEVVKIVNGAAHPAKVTLGLKSANAVEVTSGVAAGELVVVDSPLGLTSGQKVATKTAG